MSKREKDIDGKKQTRETLGGGDAKRDAARPRSEGRAWGAINKLPGGGGKFDARRNVPSGPLGGSGRKTNQSRSSLGRSCRRP